MWTTILAHTTNTYYLLSAIISQCMTYTVEYGRVLYYMNFTGHRPIINFGRKGRRVLKNANVV
jgi:hypothetical protein